MSCKEQHFQCPCCWEDISMVLDLSDGGQSYVEDCEVCCRPLTIRYQVESDDDADQIIGFEVEAS